jgi:hypothetical protein
MHVLSERCPRVLYLHVNSLLPGQQVLSSATGRQGPSLQSALAPEPSLFWQLRQQIDAAQMACLSYDILGPHGVTRPLVLHCAAKASVLPPRPGTLCFSIFQLVCGAPIPAPENTPAFLKCGWIHGQAERVSACQVPQPARKSGCMTRSPWPVSLVPLPLPTLSAYVQLTALQVYLA